MKNTGTLTKRAEKVGCIYRMMLGVIILLCFLPEVYAQRSLQPESPVNPDSIFIFSFRPYVRMFETRHGNNRQLLKDLTISLQTFREGVDTLYIEGYSGALDHKHANRGTAFWRCINLKGYLINTRKLREHNFKTRNYPFAHERWGEVVLLSLSPFTTDDPYSKSVEKNDSVTITVEALQKETVQRETVETPPVSSPVVSEEQPIAVQSSQKEHYFAIKTNLAAWAGTIPNISADIQTGKNISLELPLLWCPWHISSQHSVRTFTFQPEARYWLSSVGQGHFFGLHAHVGWFNVKWNDCRYQDTDRPLLGAGISYGYLLPLNTRWGAEFTLGAGYTTMKYDTYYNIENGVCFGTKIKNYWGITRVGISLVYRFNTTK